MGPPGMRCARSSSPLWLRERMIRAVALNGGFEQRLDFLAHGPRLAPRLPPRIRRLVVHGKEVAMLVPDIGKHLANGGHGL